MKRKLLSLLVLLMMAVTGAWATDYNITLPTVSNGSVVAKVSDVSVTSAAEGATVTLVATPDAGYKLKTISAACNISETLSSGEDTRTGTYFSVSGSNYLYGWRVGNNGLTLTISSRSGQNLSQVVLTVGNAASVAQRNISHLQADHGTLSATGTTQGNTITITGINSPTVTVSAPSSGNAASMWSITQAKIGAITLTDTSDDNVKTFTMPSSNVTVSAEFELAPINVTTNEGATGQYWATFYSNAMNYQAPEGTQVFKVALAGSAIEMTDITDRIVKKGQGVVLKKTASGSITMTPTSSNSSDDYSGNSLTGTMTSITNPGNAYVLNYKAATGAGFYKLSASGTIGANKAYLTYSSGSLAPKFFGFDGNTTSINEVRGKMEDVSGEYYDLQGRRVSQHTKGLYIVNGKKVVIK